MFEWLGELVIVSKTKMVVIYMKFFKVFFRTFLLFIFLTFITLGWAGTVAADEGRALPYQTDEPDIRLAFKLGIINGYFDGSLRIEHPLTRAELVKMIMTALGYKEIPRYESSSFTDLNGHWAKNVIELARELNLVQGDGQGRFWPDRKISHMEAEILIDRTLARVGIVTGYKSETSNTGTLSDGDLYLRKDAVNDILLVLEKAGQKYDLYGILEGYDVKQGTIALNMHGYVQCFSIAPDLEIFRGKNRVSLESYLLGTPIFAVLNERGQISYIYIETISDPTIRQIVIEQTDVGIVGNTSESVNPDKKNMQFQTWTSYVKAEKDREDENKQDWSIQTLEGNFPGGEPRPLATPEKQPELSLEVTKGEIASQEFIRQNGADGRGQVIAVIDSGVDPGHPDLQVTANGERKIDRFIDLTDEGYVQTSSTARIENGVIKIRGREYKVDLSNIHSAEVHYGFVQENRERSADASGIDLNMDGDENDDFIAVVAASKSSGVYDTVIIDTDGDNDLTDEKPLTPFNQGGEYGSFTSNKPNHRFNFVLADIDDEGRWFKLGFDANGHGTHVAGIAAANGKLKGVAPGAKIMVIKAVQANGKANLSAVEKAIWYAGANGANIANLSLGMYTIKKDAPSDLAQAVNEVTARYGTVFTIAVGNRGPGLGTVATPADADAAISVGAYISPRMWRTDYGWETVQDSVWFFSSMGPRYDGYSVPCVVAPGSAISTVPLWKGRPYGLLEGTSMAAPHVAGGVALLLDAAERAGKKVTPQQIKSALGQGARELPNLEPVEQGHGVIDLAKSWDCLNLPPATDKINYSIHLLNNPAGKSIYERDLLPGRLTMTVSNHTDTNIPIQWKTDEDWLATNLAQSAVSPNSSRKVELKLDHLEQPGLYSGYLFGENAATGNREIEFLTTVIVPHKLDKSNDCTFRTSETLGAGQFKRYYFMVPPGTAKLKATLSVPQDDDGNYLGRARLHIIDPAGNQKIMTDYAGFGLPDTVIRNQIGAEINHPKAGIWELVVYSSATLSLYGKTESQYYFVCNLVGAGESGAAPPRSKSEDKNEEKRDWYVSVVPREIIPGEPTTFTLQVRDKSTNLPVNGFAVINDRLYELNQGKAEFRIVPDRDNTKIRVSVLRENL